MPFFSVDHVDNCMRQAVFSELKLLRELLTVVVDSFSDDIVSDNVSVSEVLGYNGSSAKFIRTVSNGLRIALYARM
jgi:hypothetical protein